MILLQNPNMPVPTNAVEIDAAILDIKGHLETGLTWLTNGYGRTYKNLDATNGTTVFYPEAYLGEQNNSHRYINLSPDNDKQGQCFFYVTKENISQFQPGMYSFLSYDTAIIFSVNMELINDALLQTEIYQQILVAQVRDILTRDLLGSNYQLTITSVDFLFENVFSEFDLADAHQLEKAPLSHFRFNCTIQLPEQCPTPMILNTCYSLEFDGVNEDILLPINAVFDFEWTQPFTIAAWIYPAGGSNPAFALSKWDGSIPQGWFVMALGDGLPAPLSGTLRMQLRNTIAGTYINCFSNESITFGQWNHVAFSNDGSGTLAGIDFYINGVATTKPHYAPTNPGPLSGGSIISSEPVTINSLPDNGNYAEGRLSSARMWNIKLSSAEILAEFSNKNNPASVQTGALIINTSINSSTFGIQWNIPDLTGITAGYTSVNMEIGDKIEDCPT